MFVTFDHGIRPPNLLDLMSTIDALQLDESGNPVLDGVGEPACAPGIKPTEIAGKTFLLEDEDGDELRLTVVPHETTEGAVPHPGDPRK